MIKNIRIRNFRSISDLVLSPEDLNILVGRNDTGKSNILRAINLFFNDETDFRLPFNFERDFSKNAKTGQGKASEIRIDIQFEIPRNYRAPADARFISQTKRWRRTGESAAEANFILKGNKKGAISNRSKINSYLANIDFHYIPALKGRDFFSELLADIYDVLSEVSSVDLKAASEPLQAEVVKILSAVSDELQGYLKSDSVPRLPDNLRSVFRLIQFEADGIDLDRRGDGIRVRHIPSLIKFLCDLKSQQSGRYQSFHVWGFEEPENSVDFISAFDLREQFAEIAHEPDFQIFLSTHSPIFFQLEEGEGVTSSLFTKNEHSTVLLNDTCDITDEMGILKVVSPFVEKSKQQIEELQGLVSDLEVQLADGVLDHAQPTLFCEGATDQVLLSTFADDLGISDIKIYSRPEDGDASAAHVAHNMIGWHFYQKSRLISDRAIAVGLLDNDPSGKAARDAFENKMQSESSRYSKAKFWIPSTKIIDDSLKHHFDPKPNFEMFASDRVWANAKEQGWLEPISAADVIHSTRSDYEEQRLNQGVSTLWYEPAEDCLKFIYKVSIGHKMQFCTRFVEDLTNFPDDLAVFERTISDVKAALQGAML